MLGARSSKTNVGAPRHRTAAATIVVSQPPQLDLVPGETASGGPVRARPRR